jgi:signal peptidase I
VAELPSGTVTFLFTAPRSTRARGRWLLLAMVIVLAGCTIPSTKSTYILRSRAMEPTVNPGAEVALTELGHLHRGEVVAFLAPRRVRSADVRYLLRRIVGLPGETIAGHDAHLYINRRLLNEPYLRTPSVSRSFRPLDIPASAYFVLGDNRLHALDSVDFGPVPRSSMIGRLAS